MKKRHRLEKIGSEEGAREILQRMVEAGQLTIEDLDTPSNHWQENYDFAAKHYPAIELKPWRNLLRDIDTSEHVELTNPRDFAEGSIPRVRAGNPPILRHKEETVCTKIDHGHYQEERLPSELPF